MLTTSYKAKLPRGWSFPIGAEDLSAGLGHVAGAGRDPLRFSDWQIRNLGFRRRRGGEHPYEILSLSYSAPITESDWTHVQAKGQVDFWQVNVQPVPSNIRAPVKACLNAEALPVIALWLEGVQEGGAQQGRGFCRVLCQEGYNRLLLESQRTSFGDPTTSVFYWSSSETPILQNEVVGRAPDNKALQLTRSARGPMSRGPRS
jgi:hypothetical protein